MSTVLSLPIVRQDLPVLSEYGKGGPSACGLNFCQGSGVYCDTYCRYHVDSSNPGKSPVSCYATRGQARPDRASLLAKLQRHEYTNPADLCDRAREEVLSRIESGHSPTFFRFSTHGSLPNSWQASHRFRHSLRRLCSLLSINKVRVHFPVESYEKAEFYRRIVGHLVCVRESAQQTTELYIRGPVSFVGGVDIVSGRHIRARRIQASRALATARYRASGRPTGVCPALACQSHTVTCDQCGLCADGRFDVVFPAH